jgi:hypothetical protein
MQAVNDATISIGSRELPHFLYSEGDDYLDPNDNFGDSLMRGTLLLRVRILLFTLITVTNKQTRYIAMYSLDRVLQKLALPLSTQNPARRRFTG